MKIQSGKTAIIGALIVFIVMPFSVFAAPSAGIKPSSFFYFFDIASEQISLFFTFNFEKKVRKALEYADERLAEAEAVAGDKDTDAVKTAITNYESNITFAAEKSKDIKEKEKAEALLTTISNSTSKHQEVLTDVLAKVPDEAKEAITKTIEASRKGQEEAIRQIAELKGEVEQLKQELAELKVKDEERAKVIEELNKRKPQTTPTPASIPAQPSASKSIKITPIPKPDTTSQIPIKKDEPQSTPPANQTQDNNISTSTPPPSPTPSSFTPPPVITQTEALEITSVSVVPDVISARIEWQTNKPTSAKVFISGGGLSSKVYSSESGLSTRHVANITGLISNTSYSYEIESIVGGEQVAKKDASFTTKTGELSISTDKTSVQLTNWNYVVVDTIYTEKGEIVPVKISVSAPDFSKSYEVIKDELSCKSFIFAVREIGETGGYCAGDGKVSFRYSPKSLGVHTISVAAKGVTKTVDIQVIPYVKVDPSVIKEANNFIVKKSEGTYTIAQFRITPGDEIFILGRIDYESDISDLSSNSRLRTVDNTIIFGSTGGTPSGQLRLIEDKQLITLILFCPCLDIQVGIHTITIKDIRLFGMQSGLARTIISPPITFTFEVK